MFWNINIVLALTLIYLYLAIGLIIGLAIPIRELFFTKKTLLDALDEYRPVRTPLKTELKFILKWTFFWFPIIIIKLIKFVIKLIFWGIVTLVILFEMAKSRLRKT